MKGHILKVVITTMLWMLCHVVQAGTVTYVYVDPQGTPLAEADASGNITARFEYTPYGVSVSSMGAAPDGLGYTGHVNDPDTGFVYMQARYYDPSGGRFLSADPISPASGDLFNFNRYDYTSNNPVNHTDPDGRCIDGVTCGTALKEHVDWRMSHPGAPADGMEKAAIAVVGAMVTVSGAGAAVEIAQGAAVLSKVLSDSAGSKPLGERVSEVHGVLDPIARKQRTTAGLDTVEGPRIIGGGKRDLVPTQRQMLGSGETAAKMPGAHAEVTVLNQAAKDGLKPRTMETTRTICPSCQQAIESAGGKVVTPTRAEW